MIDESRKLVHVQEIIDTTHFRAEWRGQCYEARALPDTGSLVVGDVAFCHVMPGTTELVAITPPSGELWFTPGAQEQWDPIGHPAEIWRGELWKCVGATVTRMWIAPTNWEKITCLWWAFGNLWMATWDYDFTRVYTVNRATGAATLRAWWIVDPMGWNVNPVVDCAVFDGAMYLHCAGFDTDPEVYVRKMDPTTYATAVVFIFPHFAYTGGIAVDMDPLHGGINPALVASDGYKVYYSTDGAAWLFDKDIDTDLGTFDSFSLVTHRNADGLVYLGDQHRPPIDSKVLTREDIATWRREATGASPGGRLAATCYTQEYSTAGAAIQLWLQCWAWDYGSPDTPEVWRKEWDPADPIGVWVKDWTGPCAATGDGDAWLGCWAQGLAWYSGMVYGLWSRYSPESAVLYRRDLALPAPNHWTRVHTFANYYPANTYSASTLAMCVAPNTLRLPHEV